MAARNPQVDKLSKKVKSFLLRPALTSHFEVYIKAPSGSESFFKNNLVDISQQNYEKLIFSCSDATLPGSSFLTHESNNDFHGTTERFAYRRAYDDRIDLSFYVDAENYYTIRFFETWMKYISYESINGYQGSGRPGTKDENYFYRFKYPDGNGGYRNDSKLYVTKFERDYNRKLVYEFIKPYPISFQSIPVSYESSSLLKCTVSMTYIRYIVSPEQILQQEKEPSEPTANGIPNASTVSYSGEQVASDAFSKNASLNSSIFNNISPNQYNISSGTLSNTVGEGEEIIDAINSRQTPVESGLPYVGRNVGPLSP